MRKQLGRYVVIDGPHHLLYVCYSKKAAERISRHCKRTSNIGLEIGNNVGLYPINEVEITEWLICEIIIITEVALRNYA